MLYARFSHLYFCLSLYTLQRSLPAIAGLLVAVSKHYCSSNVTAMNPFFTLLYITKVSATVAFSKFGCHGNILGPL